MKAAFEAIVAQLDERGQRQPLMPVKAWRPELETQIDALNWHGHHHDTSVIALMAGLHLRNDSLDTSHRYAQQIEYDATGAYWHGIMHRMEGDFSNGKYWFKQAGKHPAMQEAARQIAQALRERSISEEATQGRIRDMLLDFRDDVSWHPAVFTDLVQSQQSQAISSALQDVLEQIQFIETNVLFNYTLAACEPYFSK